MSAVAPALNDCRIPIRNQTSLSSAKWCHNPNGCTFKYGMPNRDWKKGCYECFQDPTEETQKAAFDAMVVALLQTHGATPGSDLGSDKQDKDKGR